jgi:hypothetical protein
MGDGRRGNEAGDANWSATARKLLQEIAELRRDTRKNRIRARVLIARLKQSQLLEPTKPAASAVLAEPAPSNDGEGGQS